MPILPAEPDLYPPDLWDREELPTDHRDPGEVQRAGQRHEGESHAGGERAKDDVNEVRAGTECGIGVKNYQDVRVGDQIECFARVEVARTLQ